MAKSRNEKFILWFDEVTNKDVGLVGGKNASLGEMYQKLSKKGVSIPNGFATSAYAYRYFMKESGLMDRIKEILKDLNTHDMKNLSDRGEKIRQAIMAADFPEDFKDEITEAYRKIEKEYGENADMAVRSSATAEDLPDASFAGQQESYLNIKGVHNILYATKQCVSSLFTNRAISYRVDRGFDHFTIALSVGVQKMVRSDKAVSGVMFSIDTESGFRDAVVINGSYGLGENIVKGRVNPDEFYVFQPTLVKGFKPIVEKRLGFKEEKLVYSSESKSSTKNVKVSIEDRRRFCVTNEEVLQLARWATIIEDHYKRPMDMEWAKDGFTGKLFIVQARPETAQSNRDANFLEEYIVKEKGKILCSGASVGYKVGAGKANVIKDVSDIGTFRKGEVLVTEMTDPDWEPIMKIASAIVTNSGGRTCHAAIISRELGIPCIVGTRNATERIKEGKDVTVSCAEGEEGYVYEGIMKFEVKKTDLKNLKRPKNVKIMMNLGEPEQAFTQSLIPNDGVGLAREEFIINNFIKIHPMALLAMDGKVRGVHIDKHTAKIIDKVTYGYKDKTEFFVDKLAQGIGKLGAAFYPKDVIVRFSDFKTNEYANLIGGQYFEPKEENPMIGWRGASRYYDEKYAPAFALECEAIKRVREQFGLTNVIVMIPFCRTLDEGKNVLSIMKKFGLERGKNGLKVFVMAEIPANIILVDEFAKLFDGFSIGSNDLTQLTLGLDRDNGTLSHIGNEKNEAVRILIKQLIAGAHKRKRKVGICGQAPSDFPDYAEWLMKEGIDSISVTPDTVLKTTMNLSGMKKPVKAKKK
ncbi:MAG: phosphoenolpyruvate synthase [Candidatus Pacebacteria bacterium]|nr:phosphoenolpyruvate synthase [Candidatus Paceibacterota bacterium]